MQEAIREMQEVIILLLLFRKSEASLELKIVDDMLLGLA